MKSKQKRKVWEQKGRNYKWLLYGGDRDDAECWLNERGAELTAAEIEYITAAEFYSRASAVSHAYPVVIGAESVILGNEVWFVHILYRGVINRYSVS